MHRSTNYRRTDSNFEPLRIDFRPAVRQPVTINSIAIRPASRQTIRVSRVTGKSLTPANTIVPFSYPEKKSLYRTRKPGW
jgi:hypothetical protein